MKVLIGVLTYGKFSQAMFLPWIRDMGHGRNYDYFALFIYIFDTFISW